MNANVDELLREGMVRFTADLRAPANLADLARRHRGRRLMLGTAASCAAAAIAVASIAVAVVGARTDRSNLGAPAGPPIERSDVEYVRLTGAPRAYPYSIWDYGQMSRELISSSSGRPLEDDGYKVLRSARGRPTTIRTIVEFTSKTWARAVQPPYGIPPPAPPTCAHPAVSFPDGPASLPEWISKLRGYVDCGDFAVAGTERIDGVETIKLAATSQLNTSPGAYATIWIKKSDYVPIRMTGGDDRGWWRADISWLPPTNANRALVDVPIPTGFHRVGLGDFPNAILPTIGAVCHPERSHPHVRICTSVT